MSLDIFKTQQGKPLSSTVWIQCRSYF